MNDPWGGRCESSLSLLRRVCLTVCIHESWMCVIVKKWNYNRTHLMLHSSGACLPLVPSARHPLTLFYLCITLCCWKLLRSASVQWVLFTTHAQDGFQSFLCSLGFIMSLQLHVSTQQMFELKPSSMFEHFDPQRTCSLFLLDWAL